MSEVLKGLATGGWPFLVGWLLPSSVATSLFVFFVLPSLDRLPVARDVAELRGVAGGLTLAFAAVAFAVILSSLAVPLYRLLEGYSWPRPLRMLGRRRHLKRRLRIKAEYD